MLTRRDILAYSGRALLAGPAMKLGMALASCGGGSPAAQPPPASDDAFLDQIERAAFLFFW